MTVRRARFFYSTRYNGDKNDDKRSTAAEIRKIFGGRRGDFERAVVQNRIERINASEFKRSAGNDRNADRCGSNAGGRTVQESANEKSCFY